MDGEAVAKAKSFADTAYTAEAEEISKRFNQQLVEMRNKMAARGTLQSGLMTSETARIQGERLTALLQARLNAIMEGYGLHEVPIDDQLAKATVDEIQALRANFIAQGKAATENVGPAKESPFHSSTGPSPLVGCQNV